MNFLKIVLVFLSVFFGLYFLLSCFGMIWFSYYQVISEGGWLSVYSMFIGWWVAGICAAEYNEKYQLSY